MEEWGHRPSPCLPACHLDQQHEDSSLLCPSGPMQTCAHGNVLTQGNPDTSPPSSWQTNSPDGCFVQKSSPKDKIYKAPGPSLLLNQHTFLREHELRVSSRAMLPSLAHTPLHVPLGYPLSSSMLRPVASVCMNNRQGPVEIRCFYTPFQKSFPTRLNSFKTL